MEILRVQVAQYINDQENVNVSPLIDTLKTISIFNLLSDILNRFISQ